MIEILNDTKVIAVLITVIASFIGLIITKENKVSEFRKIWIDGFRGELAVLVGDLREYQDNFLLNDNQLASTDEQRKKFFIENSSLSNRLFVNINKIELRLNPEKDKDFIKKLHELSLIISTHDKMCDGDAYVDFVSSLISDAHIIMKKEWSKVKKGEPFFNYIKLTFGILLFLVFITTFIMAVTYVFRQF